MTSVATSVTLDMKLASGMTNMLAKAGEHGKRVRDRVNLKLEDDGLVSNN